MFCFPGQLRRSMAQSWNHAIFWQVKEHLFRTQCVITSCIRLPFTPQGWISSKCLQSEGDFYGHCEGHLNLLLDFDHELPQNNHIVTDLEASQWHKTHTLPFRHYEGNTSKRFSSSKDYHMLHASVILHTSIMLQITNDFLSNPIAAPRYWNTRQNDYTELIHLTHTGKG